MWQSPAACLWPAPLLGGQQQASVGVSAVSVPASWLDPMHVMVCDVPCCAAVCPCLAPQELISAHPGLLQSAVHDLSSGGALPLQLAAAGGYVDVVQLLLTAGAPLEAKDGKGLTALQVGFRRGWRSGCQWC
jgi:ankyrin repeat protein